MEAAGVLSTAFGLGLLLHASQAAFFTAISGHIKTLFIHRRRLVLLLFLLCVSIYSVFQFATLLLLEDASCSVTVRFTLFFDQAARISALALIAWKVCDETRNNTMEKVFWVAVVGLRVLLGGIIVGFTAWAFMPVCFPQPMHLAAGVVHVVFDGVCWGILLFRIVTIWALFTDQGRGGKTDGKSQGYGLFLIVLSFIGWTIGSFPYLTNVGESIFVRMIPYILTLAISISVLGCFPSIVFSIPIFRSDDPYNNRVNPFGYSVSSPTRQARSAPSTIFNLGDIESNKENRFPTYGMGLNKSYNGARTSMMFRSVIGAPIVHPGTAVPWPLDTDSIENITMPKQAKAMPENRGPSIAPSHNVGPSISGPMGPVLRNTFDAAEGNAEIPPKNPFGRVKTTDLKTAAEIERQRIDAAFEREQERKKFQEAASGIETPIIPATTPEPAIEYRSMERATSVKRKPVILQLPSGTAAFRVSAVKREGSDLDSPSSLRQSVFAAAERVSDWGMRYSTNSTETEDDDTTHYTAASQAPYKLAAPPRIPQLEAMEDDPKVMFVNEIVYDDPALVNSIMGKTDVALTTSRYSPSTAGTVRRSPSTATKRFPDIPMPARELDESAASSSSASVMDKPRVVKIVERTPASNRDHELAVQIKYNNKQLNTKRPSNSLQVDTKPLPEIPAPKVIMEKQPPIEMVFPIPPIRTPPVRRTTPAPITITIPADFSPEIAQKVPIFDPVKTPESIPSAKPTIPKKSEKRLMSTDASYLGVDFAAYETAKAWVDSVSTISEKPRYAESIIEPLPSIAYNSANDISVRSSTAMSEHIHSALQRRSLIALTISPSVGDGGESTDIEDEDPEAASSESGPDSLTQSEADEMIMSGGEGYSTEEESYEEYFSDSEKGYLDDGVVISDMEDGATHDKITLAERKLNAKLQGLTETLPHVSPHQFQIGDRIPTFSESRRKYGSRRKPPPSPIRFLIKKRRLSQQQIQAQLTMFAGTQNITPLEDLMNKLPVNQKRDRISYISDGRNSLITRLEMEMGQQESQWVGMKKTMARSSVGSVGKTPEQILARSSQNLAQRRSLLAKFKEVNSGIDRRPSATDSESLPSTIQPSMWQLQFADARIEYLSQAPLALKNPGETLAKPVAILESQNTPVSEISGSDLEVYEGSEDESPFGTNHGKSLEDCEEEQEEEIYGHDGGIQPSQATVYCPSTPSISIHSNIPSPPQMYCSSTTGSFSPNINSSPVSLLWNAHPTRAQPTPLRNQLWTYRPHSPKLPLASPPTADLRPKHRTILGPVNKATTSLWTKTRSPQPTSHPGLWRNPKELRQKRNIATPFATGRSRHPPKRVAFVEAVTVKPSGFFGKLRKLWGAQKKSKQVSITAAPATTKRRQIMEAPINRILDDVAMKYATKMLPPLPSQEAFILPEGPKNANNSSLWSHSSSIPVTGPRTLLWNPVPKQETPDTQLFGNNTSSFRTKIPRQVVLPTLTSSTLWGTSKQPAVASLWSNTKTEYLWPKGAGAAPIPGYLWPLASLLPVRKCLPLSIRHSRAPLNSPVLESTELWRPPLVNATKETTLGLWSDGRTLKEPASYEIDYLWPTTPLVSVSYTPTPSRSRQVNAPLATLTSSSLWGSSSPGNAKATLWTLPTTKSKSMLWPEGEREHVEAGSLWPSAPPAKIEVEIIKSRSQIITPLTRVESTSLWVATPACEDGRAESTGLWEPVSTVVKAASAQSTPLIAAAVLQKAGPKLWFKSQDTKIVVTGYLWPNAPELPVSASPMPATRAHFNQATLPSLESRQLWSPVAEKTGLWSPQQNLTGLWPHGRVEKVNSPTGLWPSTALFDITIEETAPLIRSRWVPTGLSRLESKQLWTPIDSHRAASKLGKMWKPVTTDPTIAMPVTSEQDKETPPVLLWAAPERVSHAIIPNYLWPSAPELSPSAPAHSTRPRTSTLKPLQKLFSTTLWSSVPVQTPHLWSAPVLESGLWPHGKLKNTTEALWPSTNPLPSQVNESARVTRCIATTLQLESSQLWSTKTVPKAQLWTTPVKSTGLWPLGEATESVFGRLWPSAVGLEDMETVSIHSRQRNPVILANLESTELWKNSSVKPSLWAPSTKESGLWSQGTFPTRKKQLWSTDSAYIVQRSNLTLRMTLGEKRRKYVRRVTLATLTSGSLWRRPEEPRPKHTVPGKIGMLTMSPINVSELQIMDKVTSISPGLWANSSPVPPVPNLSPIAALWTKSPLEAPRVKFTICQEVIVPQKRSGRTSNLQLSPVQGKLWTPSLLPEGPRQVIHSRTWVKKQTPQAGMWNVDITFAQFSEKKCLLWNRQSKDHRAVFAHLALDTCSPKQKSNTTGRSLAVLESDHLWASEKDAAHHSSGLWHMITKPAEQIEDTLSPRERSLVTPRTPTLWQKCDKPLQPMSIIPVIPSRSNKRAASNIPPPLFLAVGGPMWTSNKLGEPRPREPCQMEIIATATEKNSKLWDSSTLTRKPIFEDLSIESIRHSTATRKSAGITVPMEGSLWEKSRPTLSPARPKLWHKEEKPQGLWTVDGSANSSTMTLLEKVDPAVTTVHLWGGDNAVTAPIFADLSLESFRSRREFTAKTFSTPPEGLWRKKGASEPSVIEHPKFGLWGTTKPPTENTPIAGEGIPMKAALTLWQKGNSGTSMFADLPVESFRSKKDHSTVILPVFSEGLWKKKVALSERPQLWKPTPKATGLWDAKAKTKTLAQISLERKAKGTKGPLWSKHSASRTTTKVPQRSPLANVRISDNLTLPKVTGGLWKPKTVARQPPQLWTIPKPPGKPVKPSGSLLWAQGHGSNTTTAVPERTKVTFIPSDTPLHKVSGSLWKPKSASEAIGLWKRSIKTLATATVSPSTPLWTARTASRTTTAIPERLPSAPKKKDARSIILPPVTGSLWQPPRCSPVKGLWKAPAPPPHRTRRASLLWAAHSASRTTTATPIRTKVPKRLTEAPLQTVSGTLWKRPPTGPQPGLWKRTIPTVATFRKTSTSTLWSRESASRTTSAEPERGPIIPKPVSEKSLILPPATGKLWAPSSAAPQTITLWSRPVTPSSSTGVWDAHGRTPSLAEIRLALETQQDKTLLWQRRSVLASKAAIVDINKTPSAPQQKVKVSGSTPALPVADGSLWRPCVDGKDEHGTMWITRSSRSSSLESEHISPGVSRASTISDMSDESDSPPTTGEGDGFEPEVVRAHSTKVSVSSTIGESLWRPNEPGEKGKGIGLWSGGEVIESRRSMLVTERTVRIALPGQREQELPRWDGSHSLWSKPSTDEKALWTSPSSYACSSVSDEDFASAVSELSDESHYEDFEPSPDESDVFVSQFRRDNNLFHQPNTQLPENPPFTSSPRIKSLRRNLRPTINESNGEWKRRSSEEEEMERLRLESRLMERTVSMGGE